MVLVGSDAADGPDFAILVFRMKDRVTVRYVLQQVATKLPGMTAVDSMNCSNPISVFLFLS